jgi:hypothetical protein
MSRFRDFGESFGLVRKEVSGLRGGGVTAGSTGSDTNAFRFNTFVAMKGYLFWMNEREVYQ